MPNVEIQLEKTLGNQLFLDYTILTLSFNYLTSFTRAKCAKEHGRDWQGI